MTIRGLEASSCLLGILLMTSCACGPGTAQTEVGISTSTDNGSGTTAIPTGSSTGTPEPCSQVQEGNLVVRYDTDLTPLADIGRVEGNLYVIMDERDQQDLSFLKCVHTIDGFLSVQGNKMLESTEGMENLKSVKAMQIEENANLRVVAGFEQVRRLTFFDLDKNPSLEVVQFDSLENVKSMGIGHCANAGPAANQLALVALSGFGGLTEIETLHIEGNEALMSEGLLEALKANGAASPLQYVKFRFNPLLDEATIHARIDVLGVKSREVCGNAGGAVDPECFCVGAP